MFLLYSSSPVSYFFSPRYELAWQGFDSGGATGVASVTSCWKLPPCLINPVPAGSKTDPPLAKAKPISDSGSASGITYLRKGRKNTAGKRQLERGVRQCERNNSADTKVSEEAGGRRYLKHQSREAFLATRDEDHGEAGCSLAIHGGLRWSRSPPVAHGRDPMPGIRWMPEGHTLWGAPCWSRLLPGPADLWREEPMPEQVCWQGW